MNKLNCKGFALVETLIVTLFVMMIFTMLYANFLPLVGEYEKREFYDDVDSKYSTYWIKKIIEDPRYILDKEQIDNNKYILFSCSQIPSQEQTCNRLLGITKAEDIYITKYQLTNFKEKIKNTTISSKFKDYVAILPEYKTVSPNYAEYRVLVSFKKEVLINDNQATLYSFATLEVNR